MQFILFIATIMDATEMQKSHFPTHMTFVALAGKCISAGKGGFMSYQQEHVCISLSKGLSAQFDFSHLLSLSSQEFLLLFFFFFPSLLSLFSSSFPDFGILPVCYEGGCVSSSENNYPC